MRLPERRHSRNRAAGHISKILAFSLEQLHLGSNFINDTIIAIGNGRPQVAPTYFSLKY